MNTEKEYFKYLDDVMDGLEFKSLTKEETIGPLAAGLYHFFTGHKRIMREIPHQLTLDGAKKIVRKWMEDRSVKS